MRLLACLVVVWGEARASLAKSILFVGWLFHTAALKRLSKLSAERSEG